MSGGAQPNVFGQVAAAAAQDPRMQQAAQQAAADAARDPRVQQAAVNAGQQAAGDAARRGARIVGNSVIEIKTYVQSNHFSIRILCFCIALALLVSSILGIFNVFAAVFDPLQYLLAVYNVLFAVVILVIDGSPDWSDRCMGAQRKVYSAMPVLAGTFGRAFFYFYVGSMNLLLLPDSWFWKVLYLCIGGCLCAAGIAMVVQHFMAKFKGGGDAEGQRAPAQGP